jgi:uncharacterized protein YunC (DUF1805 family)
MTHEKLQIDGQEANGYVIPLETCNLVFVTKGNSLLACGAVDVLVMDKFNVPTAKVTGVATVEDLLNGEVKAVNQAAEARGATVGQSGRDALARM